MKLLSIFFDLDNTLIPTRKADETTITKLMDILIQKYSFSAATASSVSTNYLKTFRTCPDDPSVTLDVWRTFLWTQALGDNYKHLAEQIYQTWLDLRYTYFSLSSEVKRLLKALRKNYYVVLITNGPSAAQWEKIERTNLKPLFDFILVSGDLPWEKPHKKIFLEACNSINIHPQHCIMVGDKLDTDILGGIKSKLGATVWMPLDNEQLKEGDPVPDFIVQSLLELPKILTDLSVSDKNTGLVSDLEDSNSNSSDGS